MTTTEVDFVSLLFHEEKKKRFHIKNHISLLFFFFFLVFLFWLLFAFELFELFSFSLSLQYTTIHFSSYTHNNMPIIMSSERVVRRLRP